MHFFPSIFFFYCFFFCLLTPCVDYHVLKVCAIEKTADFDLVCDDTPPPHKLFFSFFFFFTLIKREAKEMGDAYKQLFRPCRIGRWTAKNRIFMSPLTRCRADDDHVPTPMMVEYYASRASMGLIITESIMVERDYSAMAYEPGIYSAAQVAAWRAVTDAVHARGGLIAAQIYHGGRATVAANLTGAGMVPVGASAVPIAAEAETCLAAWSRDGVAQPFAQTIHALSGDEVRRMVATFARAAHNAIAAGFDSVEIHAGTGFLIDEFLRDGSNKRTDEYGGSIENRARFLLEVVDAVAAAIQPDRVGVRLTPLDSTNGESDSAPERLLRYVCDELDRRRVAFIDLFRGDPKASAVVRSELWARESFGGAILASHGYADAAAAERAIAEGAVDAVCFGLPAVSNPDLVWRILSGTPLNTPDLSTLFTRGREGYVDYPIAEPAGFRQPSEVSGATAAVASRRCPKWRAESHL